MAKDPTWTLEKEMAKRNPIIAARLEEKERKAASAPTDSTEEDLAEAIKPGMRCQLKIGGRRGEVKYVGRIPQLAKGFWVGIQLDEPVGKNDGSVKGVRYFECMDEYGSFVRPSFLDVGDFPEDDPFADLEDEGEI